MPTFPLVDRLPDPMLALVGEIVTAWAMQEHELRLIVFLLLSLDPKRGRLAVKSSRAKDTVDLISDLLHLDGIQSKTTKLKEFGELLEEIESRRNSAAHNVWLRAEDGTLFLQNLVGTWPGKKGEHRRKRRIDPAGIPVGEESLRDVINALRQTIAQTRLLRREIASILESKGTPVSSPNE